MPFKSLSDNTFRILTTFLALLTIRFSLKLVKVLFCKTKDELRYNYGIIRCGAALFDQLDKAEILAYRKDDYQWNVLVADKEKARRKYKNAVVDDATIDDILLLYVKGEQAK